MNQIRVLLLSVLWISMSCHGLNILVVFPHVGKSHQLVFDPLFKQLAFRGHNLTVLTRFPQKEPIANWRDVNLGNDDDHTTEILDMGMLTGTRLDQFLCRFLLVDMSETSCDDGLAKKDLHNFLRERNHFDLILVELFNTNCFMGLAKIFDAPVIGLSSTTPPSWIQRRFGNPQNPSYIPSLFTGFSDTMTFLERVENTLMLCWDKFFYNHFLSNDGNIYSKKHLAIDVLDEGDTMYNVSLMLINTHFTLNLPRPFVPNIIEVGGIHLGEPKEIPHEIQKFINESTHGVVYMSMGSTLKGSTFPLAQRDAFFKVFSRIQQRVIWKWETTMENEPENVRTFSWIPQKEILCHPNVKVFISHGGLLGTIEAVNCGVPIIVIPQFGDQPLNAKALETIGGGVILNMENISEKTILEAINTVMSPKFRQSARDLSERFRDRPLSPMDTAVYWIEYVAKYKGAPHLRTAAVALPTYQYLLLDVISFIAFILLSISYGSYKLVAFMFRKYWRRTKIKKS